MPEPERLTIFTCRICNKPVHLEELETDGCGDPVHKECLAKTLRKEEKKRKAALGS